MSDRRAFPLLADPNGYVACEWDLSANAPERDHWIGVFRNHLPRMLDEAARHGWAGDAAGARARFDHWLDQVHTHDRLTILDCCIERENVLRYAGIDDAYEHAKRIENERSLAVLSPLLEQLDAMDDADRREALIQGVFAGNIFDLGAVETADLFEDGATVDFRQVRAKLKPRPWRIDDFDAWLANPRTYRSACMFVDNAGPDIVLGMIPFARDLLRQGTAVLLIANDTPTLNDITVDELHELIETIAAEDATIRDAWTAGRLEGVGSGNGYPLIDLSEVSGELADTVDRLQPDLLVIEGMGRAVESNLNARFTCDTLKLAMVKDPGVSRMLGGELYDLVCRFEPSRS